MTHDEIEAQNLSERYLMGKLSTEECAGFEEHFVDCPECLDRLEAAERFRAALKPVAAADAARWRPTRLVGGRWRTPLLAAAALIVAAGTAVFFAMQAAGGRRELDLARIASADWKHRYEMERGANETLRSRAAAPGQASPLPVAGAVFYLNTPRGAGAEPLNRITVTPDPHWVILALDREVDPGFVSLRATLTDAGRTDAAGDNIWQQSGLRAAPGQTLNLVLPSSLFHSGDYILTLEGLVRDGRYLAAGRYRFRAAIGPK
jgi:Putative zinc-finger